MIARIQRIFIYLLLVCCVAYSWYSYPNYARIFAVFLALSIVFIDYLAILFAVIHFVNRKDQQARATIYALFLALIREATTAPRVFLWRQPFRTQAISDALQPSNKAGVVFIHGFFCNRAFWSPWMVQLQSQNRAFASVTLEPAFGSIDDYAAIVEAAVANVTHATGQAPTLICHSMGGLAARAWLRSNASNDSRVKRIITIGSPHFGTALSTEKALLPFINTHQMQRLGAWTTQLAKDEPDGRYAKFTCWYSNCDNIVVPTSTAMLPGADNRFVTAQGHVSMAFSQRVMQESLALLD
jgi:predicted alpha/beta hydrolase family esterase